MPTVRVVVEVEVREGREERDAVLVVVFVEEENGLAVAVLETIAVLVNIPDAVVEPEERGLLDTEELTVAVFVIELVRVIKEEADAERDARIDPVEVVDLVAVLDPVEERVELAVPEDERELLLLELVVADALVDFVDVTELVVVLVTVAVLELVEDAVEVLVCVTVFVSKLVAEDVLEGFTLRVAKLVALGETDATELTLGFFVGTELRVEVDVLVAVRLLVAVNVGNNRLLSKFRSYTSLGTTKAFVTGPACVRTSVGGVVATIPKEARSKRNRIPTLHKISSGQFRRPPY
jgi:hypothetical protein